MSDGMLFPHEPKPTPKPTGGTPRLQRAVRNQVEFIQSDLDSVLTEDHPARIVWSFVEGAELSSFYESIRAVDGHAGRPPIDPKILLALWLFATIDGVGSAREVERLCEQHLAYRWICGGVSVNYHTLAEFRAQCGKALDKILTESITRLLDLRLVTLNRVAHDGLRVQASAGKGSFSRKEKLDRNWNDACAQVKALRDELDDDPGGGARRKQAARERVVRERQERVAQALREFPKIQEQRKHDKDQASVSTTDVDARIMRMPNGGWQPGYNVQFSVDTATRLIVHADVGPHNSDGGLLRVAVNGIQKRYGRAPRDVLADGGFAKREDIIALTRAPHHCVVYLPPPKLKTHAGQPIQPRENEPPEVKAWRARMATEQGKEIYKERCSSVECVNAQVRNRGLRQFRVRGLEKTHAVTLLYAVAHNLTRLHSLNAKSA